MKSTGMVRKVDELGRITLPKELRRMLGIENGDPAEIFIDGDKVILKKYKPNMACAVTGEVSDNNYSLLGGKLILSQEGLEKLLDEIEK
ncbi:AbrB/MazE/SpoVT family DNA-binding domain-containing protein [Lysinibacillus fusiformis]|uniref:AbrB/MazE/SpoVT family DNA-binding domain-containing protein n=1 Tax=Lysinibacillus fusiformis TaxID=28031 RepID=UPI00088FE013|nr:AbrB/MazE/SpoVT family DNA-binding domain-containing protein [Lysinibacillus fusiformis]SCX38345.1 transcriptional pleiotropic regulator of transition state genes [Lysinibacillus fusiformis]SDB05292.1 transcriptional pleiotropic regulator of transition state genes [Lysinibacillus fusiformis]SFH75015.1 transcriptional pleiotropic regulator of transition state genes [Lysinibacillus fusiformis]SFT29735.1 transcriptional pleiotropic regulator of transition state genes [Lysinibacillus fusiformis]